MNHDKYVVTMQTLEGIIIKEFELANKLKESESKIEIKFKEILICINKEQEDIYSLLNKLYEAYTYKAFKYDDLEKKYYFDKIEENLEVVINDEMDLYVLYSNICNNDNNFLYKNYFQNILHYKNRHAILLNMIYTDIRGCHCHEKQDKCQCLETRKIDDEISPVNPLLNIYWQQHVWWTRQLVISIIDELKDTDEVTARLLKNPQDIASLFKTKYGVNVYKAVNNLLTDHLVIGKNLILAVKNDNSKLIEELNAKWYKNADEIAAALESINSKIYDKQKWIKLLYDHLDMTKKEVECRLTKKYNEDIKNFDEIEKEALIMAKEMAKGL